MRGESERVAERVRSLLAQHGRPVAPPTSHTRSPAGSQRGSTWWRRVIAHLAVRVPVRVDPGRRGAIAVGVAVVVAAVLTGAWVLAARPSALPVSSGQPSRSSTVASPRPASLPSAATSGPPSVSESAALVVVDVAGKVRHPGVYRLPLGSRVDDALRAAGGALPRVRLDRLNLAAKLIDGEQVAVGVAAAAGGAPGAPGTDGGTDGGTGSGTGGGTPSAPVALNTATLEQLQTLPGVGPVLAQHILDWRSAHRQFASVDQLNDVPGIGDVKFAALKTLVTV